MSPKSRPDGITELSHVSSRRHFATDPTFQCVTTDARIYTLRRLRRLPLSEVEAAVRVIEVWATLRDDELGQWGRLLEGPSDLFRSPLDLYELDNIDDAEFEQAIVSIGLMGEEAQQLGGLAPSWCLNPVESFFISAILVAYQGLDPGRRIEAPIPFDDALRIARSETLDFLRELVVALWAAAEVPSERTPSTSVGEATRVARRRRERERSAWLSWS